MSNSYFKFKQFTVHQDRCAMKVCTDACLFGAWLGAFLKEKKINIEKALDVGAGTGLLSLMIAQQHNFIIDAIEINPEAFSQCEFNVMNSPWHENIFITNIALQQFCPNTQYNLIFSNPPFYEDDLQSESSAKNQALHGATLRLEEVIEFIKNNLQESGMAALIIPHKRWEYLNKIIHENGFFVNKLTLVRQTIHHDYFRAMVLFSRDNIGITEDELFITDENRNYSTAFKHLLKDYYLYI